MTALLSEQENNGFVLANAQVPTPITHPTVLH